MGGMGNRVSCCVHAVAETAEARTDVTFGQTARNSTLLRTGVAELLRRQCEEHNCHGHCGRTQLWRASASGI
jgi:hypothetical protein